MYRVDGGARAVDDQAECPQDEILADAFGLESGETTEGSSSIILYYDHIHTITRNKQLLYIRSMPLCSYNSGYFVPINRDLSITWQP